MPFKVPFLAICPRIGANEQSLVAVTPPIIRWLTLGFHHRRVTVDRQAGIVRVERLGWVSASAREFQFRHIAAVTCGYEDCALDASFSVAHDSFDVFITGLRLANNEEIVLFRFSGDGSFTNDGPLPDWWYWREYATDWSGTQERESRLYVQLISKIIAVPVEPSSVPPDCD